MHYFKILLLVYFPIILFAQRDGIPKNVILMVGDGMGLGQITAAQYHKGSPLNMTRLPVAGFITTHAINNLITDSAAAATALSTGEKTKNKFLGVDSIGRPLIHMIQLLQNKNMKSGLLVTCSITHATPAGFYAYQLNRDHYEAIAADFLDSGIDLIIGGGRFFFEHRKTDDRNLIKELQNKNYVVNDYAKQDFLLYENNEIEKLAFFTADDHPAKKSAGRDYLPHATKFALDFLNNRSENGFFAMIEGSLIDWGGHDMDAAYIIEETLDFDEAVAAALEFAESNGETLLIVLADHETGGMAIVEGSKPGNIKALFTCDDHTGTMVPIMSYGPGSSMFSGFMDITDIPKRILELLIRD